MIGKSKAPVKLETVRGDTNVASYTSRQAQTSGGTTACRCAIARLPQAIVRIGQNAELPRTQASGSTPTTQFRQVQKRRKHVSSSRWPTISDPLMRLQCVSYS